MKKHYDFFIILICFLIGLTGGMVIIKSWNNTVESEVKEVLNKVVMVDVPLMDTMVSDYLEENPDYAHKYMTAIDTERNSYGIYEIDDGHVKAYAHGSCESTGDLKDGVYKITGTKSHLDYHDVRYWRVIELVNNENENDEIIVSSSGYEIDDAPKVKESEAEGFGNAMIDSNIMLTVYDNAEEGIVLIVCGGGDSAVAEEKAVEEGKSLSD